MRRWAPVLFGAWSACCACDHRGGSDGGALFDSGRDAPALDTAPRRDAGDEPGADAPSDAAPDPDWVSLLDTPTPCLVEAARRPETALRVAAAPCTDTRARCRTLTPEVPGRLQDVWAADGEAWAAWYVLEVERQLLFVASAEGAVSLVWRASEGAPLAGGLCSIGVLDMSSDRIALAIRERPPVGLNNTYLFVATPSTAGSIAVPDRVIDPMATGGRHLQRLYLGSDGTLGGDLQPASTAFALAPDGTLRLLSGGTVTGLPDSLSIVGPTLFWVDFDSSLDVAFGTPTSGPDIFLSVPGVEIPSFLADEGGFAWYQGYGAFFPEPYTRLELWSAPYTDDPAMLTPRRVAELTSTDLLPLVVGDGIIARHRLGTHEVELIDLADGRTRHYALPAGYYMSNVLFVSAEEVWVSASGDGEQFALGFDPREVPYD